MQYISVLGFKGSGKDTVGDILVDNHGFVKVSFAGPLKDAVAAIFSWDRELLEGSTSESREWREHVDMWWSERLGIPNLTPRFVLQYIGTDVFRDHYHNDIWIAAMERRVLQLDTDKVVVTDCRFPNEISLARKFCGQNVKVTRGNDPVWYTTAYQAALVQDPYTRNVLKRVLLESHGVHESEWAWLGAPVDRVIHNDGTLADLKEKVASLVK